MDEPYKKIIMNIARTWLQAKTTDVEGNNQFVPYYSDQTLSDLIDYSNAYVRDLAPINQHVLDKCVGICRKQVLNSDATDDVVEGTIINTDILVKAFAIEVHHINTDLQHINVVISPKIKQSYNGALFVMPSRNNTLIGYRDQMQMLGACLYRLSEPDALLLGDAGIGETALVEQLIYERQQKGVPLCIVALSIEKLGALKENVMINKMRTLLTDLLTVELVTREANPNKEFQMALFIDEIHKLSYGKFDSKSGSLAAMNALKEGLARDEFPLIRATTDYEYRRDIVADTAFDRRFGKIIIKQPSLEDTVHILRRRLESYKEQYDNIPQCDDYTLKQIILYADAFIRNIVNPAKSLSILNSCIGFCRKLHQPVIDHAIIAKAFLAEGYTIDTTTPQHIIDVVNARVLGQFLALDQLANVVRNGLYLKRDFKKPLMTVLFVGSTGIGKTETAKSLAYVFFGREDALIT